VPVTRLIPLNEATFMLLHLKSTKLKKKKMIMSAKAMGITERFVASVFNTSETFCGVVAGLAGLELLFMFVFFNC
jgi:hypothetical protein